MNLVQCFKCEQHVDAGAVQVFETTDSESYGAPPIKRAWCGTCIRTVKETTEEALRDLDAISDEIVDEIVESDKEVTEDSEEDGWQIVASFEEAKQLLENE